MLFSDGGERSLTNPTDFLKHFSVPAASVPSNLDGAHPSHTGSLYFSGFPNKSRPSSIHHFFKHTLEFCLCLALHMVFRTSRTVSTVTLVTTFCPPGFLPCPMLSVPVSQDLWVIQAGLSESGGQHLCPWWSIHQAAASQMQLLFLITESLFFSN